MHPNPMPSSTDTGAEEIEVKLRPLLQQPLDESTGEWLFELLQESGHLSTPEHLRWRVLCTVWLAFAYDTDKVWPYLMWLNMNEPTIGDHLDEILTEAVDDFGCHVQLANWITNARDERMRTFLSSYKNIPHSSKIRAVFGQLLRRPKAPDTGTWLAGFCRDTADNSSPSMRPWRLLSAAWVATCFDATEGAGYLQKLSDGRELLTPADNQLLTDTANELNATPALIQWIADCTDPTVKTLLKDIGHPNPGVFAEQIFDNDPDYAYLSQSDAYAANDATTFNQYRELLEQAGISAKETHILDLACGPLATHTLLFASIGYTTVGADLYIPPAYLPTSGIKQSLKKRKHVAAWKNATVSYYRALAQQSNTKLKWGKAKIELADLTRLQLPDANFDVVVCVNHLQHTPDVAGLLAEALRVLKPGGLLLFDIVPYASLNGAFAPDATSPWEHLRGETATNTSVILNQWREAHYRSVLEQDFAIEQWLTEQDEEAAAQLTPEIKAELTDFDTEELTRTKIVVLARKRL
jgi:SAM-dependent methyltransferase